MTLIFQLSYPSCFTGRMSGILRRKSMRLFSVVVRGIGGSSGLRTKIIGNGLRRVHYAQLTRQLYCIIGKRRGNDDTAVVFCHVGQDIAGYRQRAEIIDEGVDLSVLF